jgi:hypothetical protein
MAAPHYYSLSEVTMTVGPFNGNTNGWIKLITMQGVPAALLIFLVILGATAFARDLAEVKTEVKHNAAMLADLNRHMELMIRIHRQTCVNTANGDRLAIAGCMVTE